MKQMLIGMLMLTALECEQVEEVESRQAVPLLQVEWTNETSWVPPHSGASSMEACEDTLTFDPAGWTCGGEIAEALGAFFLKSSESPSSIPMDRIERILMNSMAGMEQSDELPDPRSFVASASTDTCWLQQFLPVMVTGIGPGKEWSAEIRTSYPLDGDIRIVLDGPSAKEWTIAFRQPGWTNNAPDPVARYRWRTNRKLTAELSGEYVFPQLIDGYAYITREWKPGEVLEITFPMSVRRLIFPGAEGETRMSMEIGPVVLATTSNPETSETLPDQGYLQQRENSDGVSVWDWTVEGVHYEFYRLPELAKSSEVLVDWLYEVD